MIEEEWARGDRVAVVQDYLREAGLPGEEALRQLQEVLESQRARLERSYLAKE